MSKFHASLKDLFEDIYSFLAIGLQNEVLSSANLTHREKLLTQLSCFQKDYPELQLNFVAKSSMDGYKSDKQNSPHHNSSSPVSYVDMNGSSPYKIPSFQTNAPSDEFSYDCSSSKEKSESQSIAESEDYLSDDAKNLPYVSAAELASCDKAGYLDKKKRDSLKGWLNPYQRRWCAIKEGVFYYFEKTSDRKQKGSIVLAGYEARTVPENDDTKKYNNCFELVCPGKRTYQFSASSEKDMLQWIAAVEKNCKVTYSGKSTNQYQSGMSVCSYTPSKESDYSYDTEDIYETVLEEDEITESPNNNTNGAVLDNEEYSDVDTIPEQSQTFNYSEWYVGLWDCKGEDETELSFVRGDLIRVVSKEFDSFAWWVGELQGKTGFVPKSYLMEAYETY